jgi:hypothetical protein
MDPVALLLAIRSRSSDILNLVDQTGHGAGRLATDLLTKVLVRVPDLLQTEVFCGHLRNLVSIGARAQAENQLLAQLRDDLLPKLMSGHIHMRDSERTVEDVT